VNLTRDKSNRHVVHSNKYHVVLCPKYQRQVLVGTVAKRLARLLRTLCGEMKVNVLALEIIPDHVHFLCEVDPHQRRRRLVER
jgi:putative transposase